VDLPKRFARLRPDRMKRIEGRDNLPGGSSMEGTQKTGIRGRKKSGQRQVRAKHDSVAENRSYL